MFHVYLNKMKCAISVQLAIFPRAFMVQQVGIYLYYNANVYLCTLLKWGGIKSVLMLMPHKMAFKTENIISCDSEGAYGNGT